MKDLLSAFNANGVEYLVIGGYAYGVHLEPRATKDLDLFIRSSEGNAAAVFRALAQFGATVSTLSPADFTDGSTFQLGVAPERVDIIQAIDGVTFDEALGASHPSQNRRRDLDQRDFKGRSRS